MHIHMQSMCAYVCVHSYVGMFVHVCVYTCMCVCLCEILVQSYLRHFVPVEPLATFPVFLLLFQVFYEHQNLVQNLSDQFRQLRAVPVSSLVESGRSHLQAPGWQTLE